jgi:tyrosine-protein kinase Etk/Wzc
LPNRPTPGEAIQGDKEDISLFELVSLLLKRKRLIIAITASTFMVSAIVSLLLPKVYRASASVIPPTQEMPVGIGGLIPGAERTSRFIDAFVGTASPADLWVGILSSNSVKDTIIRRFDLMAAYKTDTIEDARERLESRTDIKKSREGIVSIRVEDRDPKLAADVANAYIEELDMINKNMVTTSGGRMRQFIENRLDEARTTLTKAEDVLRQFQEKNNAVSLDAQFQAVIETIGSLKGELLAKEIRLETMLSYSTPGHPEVEVLRSEIEHISQKLSDLEHGTLGTGDAQEADSEPPRDIFIPTERIPSVTLEYGRLLRDAKMQETLYELLSEQYEIARIQEARDTPTVQILDRASPPTKKVKPRRKLIVAGAALIGFFFSALLALFLEYVRSHTSSEDRKGNAQRVGQRDTQI